MGPVFLLLWSKCGSLQLDEEEQDDAEGPETPAVENLCLYGLQSFIPNEF